MTQFSLPEDAKRGGHCGVQAVAIASQKLLEETKQIFKANCSRIKKQRSWVGGTLHHERVKVLKHLGVKFKEVKPSYTKGVTLQRFVKDIANPKATYIVTTTHHVQLVKGSDILDQRGVSNVSDFWGSRKKISKPVLQIIKAA
jgi:hypothetical protein